jgi:hypothetical protein
LSVTQSEIGVAKSHSDESREMTQSSNKNKSRQEIKHFVNNATTCCCCQDNSYINGGSEQHEGESQRDEEDEVCRGEGEEAGRHCGQHRRGGSEVPLREAGGLFSAHNHHDSPRQQSID